MLATILNKVNMFTAVSSCCQHIEKTIRNIEHYDESVRVFEYNKNEMLLFYMEDLTSADCAKNGIFRREE